jgi:hypothetical protein
MCLKPQGTVSSPLAILPECERSIAAIVKGGEDPTMGVKYLANALKGDYKYRRMRKANHSFLSEVWLNPGVRSLFKALGFVESGGWVVLDPLHDETKAVIESSVWDLARKAGKPQLAQLLVSSSTKPASSLAAAAPAHGTA